MDQGSGSTVTDASVEHNNGTTRDATWVDGKYGKALSFNGSSSWVTIPHAASLRLTNRMTLSAWVKPSTISGWRTAMMKEHAGGSAYGLYASNGTVPTAWMLKSDATNHYQVNGTAGLATGAWTHLAVTYDGSMARLYVNATKVSELAIGGGLMDDGGALHIGGNTKWGEYFSGVIDEVRVYNLAQSVAQIQTDMDTPVATSGIPTTPPTPALVAGYGMDEGTGTNVADNSGNNNAGTVRDTTWAAGKFGKALSFNGSSSWVTIPHAASLRLNTGMTMSTWIKPTTTSGWRTVAMKDHAGGVTYGLYASNSTGVPSGWFWSGGSNLKADGTTALPAGTWTHLAVTHDGSTARLYVNGTQVSTAAIGGLQDDGGALHIGGNTQWGEYFSGLIDELRIYNYPQNAQQLQADMNAQVAPPIPGNPPSAPGTLTANPGEGKIALAWQAATDDYGISGYEIHRSKQADFTPSNTTKLTTVTGLSYTNTDLPGTGTYYYRVIALDNTGQPGASSNRVAANLKTLTIRIDNITSDQAVDKAYELGSPETFKLKIKACLTGYPDLCNESPYYRITTDAPFPPSSLETGLAAPSQPILSGVVSRPSSGLVTAKFFLYDSSGAPIGTTPFGEREVNGGARASLQIPENMTQAGRTYKWQMQACVSTSCTAKTAPVSFNVPGTPTEPEETVRHLTLLKDNLVIKVAKTGSAACDGGPCPLADSTTMRFGGSGEEKTVTVLGIRLNELPDGAGVSEAVLNLGTPTCSAGNCPSDAVINAVPLKSPVTADTLGASLVGDVEDHTSYSLPITAPQANIAGSEYQWLLLSSNKDDVITFAESGSAQQPSIALTYLPAGPPSKVLNLSSSPGDGGAIASWGVPETSGGAVLLDGYDVEVSNGNTVVRTIEASQPTVAISGLTNGISYTIRVRARNDFGASDWESTSVTPNSVPAPPTPSQPCDPNVDMPRDPDGQPASVNQAYSERIRNYYQAQDAILEGRATTVWEAPGVTPDAPITAKLSVLNTQLIADKEAADAEGLTRTDSTVMVDNVVAQIASGGTVRVTATVDRNWNETSQNAASATQEGTGQTASGQIDPSGPPTISVFIFDRCGDLTIVDVPFEVEEDPTDLHDTDPPGGHCGSAGVSSASTLSAGAACSTGVPVGTYQWVTWAGNLGRERDSKTGKIQPGKSWHTFVQNYSNWEIPGTYNEWREKWEVRDLRSLLQLFPATKKQWNSGYGKYLVAHAKLQIKSEACFRTTETEVVDNVGFTVGTDTYGSVGTQFKTTTGYKCIPYSRTLGKGMDPTLSTGVGWLTAECLRNCSISHYRHHTTAKLLLTFRAKSGRMREAEVVTDIEAETRRHPPQTPYPDGSFDAPVNKVGSTLKTPILEG
ncbi:hypothetical protein DQ384_37550 [Sphaerisporangium album]|uniref:Fibronectin type-III domain-containing protein n=2 Tax=Sphaerisporangium album TaxID=509200 RepID=A0A367EQB1_9ACTN|nr:hypothetical protein DQ384_37550 [Sphaerisporangium album]